MNCLVCGRELYVWDHSKDHDYYCPALHGPLGEGLFFREEWDGTKYVLVHSKPTAEVIKEWPAVTAADKTSTPETTTLGSPVGRTFKARRSLASNTTRRASTRGGRRGRSAPTASR